MRTAIGTWIITIGLALGGCGGTASGDADSTTEKGEAPTIADLSLSPLELDVGKTTAIGGTVSVDDADGDIAQIGVEVSLPNGTRQNLPPGPAQGASGVKSGTLTIALALAPPAPGNYTLDVFVIDGKGHESNRLSVTVSAK